MPALKAASVSNKRKIPLPDATKGAPSKAEVAGHDHFAPKSMLLYLLLFFSGAAALIYQVLWIRQLTLVVGVEVYSITIAVSAFFAGLASGGAFIGRIADRWSRPLLGYALLEFGVALTGISATLALGHAARPFVVMQDHIGFLAWSIPFLLVGVPAFFMGGTLPVAVRSQSRTFTNIAKAGGWIYAANTTGGISGALLVPFLLVPHLGVIGTAVAAAILNLFAAGLALVLRRRAESDLPTAKREILPSGRRSIQPTTALILYGVAGSIALGYEVVWSQAMAQFLSTRVFAFSIVLATYLCGLSIGTALYARFGHAFRDTWGVFGFLITAAGVIAVLEIAVLSLWQLRIQFDAGNWAFALTGSELARMCAQFLVAALGIVFLPTVLLGAAFPAVLKLAANADHAGRDVGAVLSLNTAGGIIGTLLTGFLLIPVLGLVRTLSLLAIAAAMVGALAVVLGAAATRKMQWLVLGMGTSAVIVGVLTPPDRLERLLLTTRGGGAVLFYQESRGGTVAVAEHIAGDNAFRRLYIQGVSNSGDAMPSLRYMRLQALLPLLIHRGEPRSTLVIGFGTGITTGALLRYPQLEKRVCAELLPAVIQAGDLFPENYNAAHDNKVQIRVRDGRQELLRSDEKYDLITLEPPPPSAEGVVNLYSRDFYQLAKKRVDQDGMLAQWLPISTQNDEDTRSLVRSFLDVFPYATLWTTELHEMLLIGSDAPMELDAKEIATRFADPKITATLSAVGIASPAALLATYVTDRQGLERYVSNAPPVTDNDPRIEYSTWVRALEITRVLPKLLSFQSDPPLKNADAKMQSAISTHRQSLFDFYAAGIAAYNGDRELWGRTINRVVSQDSENPYYRWIIGGRQ
jgi:spermidine synthase